VIDCHAHLADPAFADDLDMVLARAEEAGVTRVIVVGEDLDDDHDVLTLCAAHPALLRPCVGLHPDRFAEESRPPASAGIDAVCALARNHRRAIVAIGEVGLDYWYVKTEERRAAQRACLARMAALARELDVPLNVHSRSAGHHALDVLRECGARRVLMHAFDGKAGYAQRAAAGDGYLFSVPPSIVRSEQKQRLVAALPLESLALESDSPVLGPDPTGRNEPANLTAAVRCIAGIHGVGEDRVREVTDDNARRLFFPGERHA
jgi:TatD DNase family protein